ncbi:MAG: hypothetical protein EOR43_28830 [Mesorhizobium sp.]|uniref:hypothetical protein n=1 Tax=Mesorhizobium sp. TaxID=1871066 RepID=UPI000FE3FA02|nr:hypothetical protein [Mesorhizobium sp.]RWK17051.1 MAG: hypothetical protein EOR43_28830 [Mesorhizobium sp.]RWK27358.1 MAG: hypothetical protein EOR44_27810 [Mesorhizobium sp.]
MPLDPTLRDQLLASTRHAAEAMVEDLQHIRVLVGKVDQTRDELRRMSAILRRLLVDGDLSAIAAPRVGKITIQSPDNTPFYKAISPQNTQFFLSGGAHIFGLAIRGMLAAIPSLGIMNYDPERMIPLRIDNFLSQRVVFWKGDWISRGEIIKYVANVAAGVHSGAPQTLKEKLLADVRHQFVIGLRGEGIGIAIRPADQEYDEDKLGMTAAAIDVTLIELFAAARFLVESREIIELEELIRAEIKTKR